MQLDFGLASNQRGGGCGAGADIGGTLEKCRWLASAVRGGDIWHFINEVLGQQLLLITLILSSGDNSLNNMGL